jgi:pSer/pThr/pTyr-binding forkhead associated (FHA) protein
MNGAQTLAAVLKEARARKDALASTFRDPVLLVLPEAINLEGDTVTVTREEAGGAPTNFDGPQSLVVPIRRRIAKSTEPRISFGRSSICDVVLAYTPVSKHHGHFEERLGVWHVVDVGSTNGTILDGKKVPHGGAMLRDGSVLQFGHVFARFYGPRAFVELLRAKLQASAP